MENLSSKTRYQLAQEKVARLRDFYNHLAFYIVVMSGLAILNYVTSSFFWVVFPLVFWGFGILGHAANTFQWNFFFGRDWEQRQLKKFMDQDDF